MINKKKINIIGLIAAKKNSRDLKNKNFKKLNNYFLFEIALLGSLKSKLIKKTFLSSDSKKMLNIGKNLGSIPIKRDKKLCSYEATANQVIYDFIKKNISIDDINTSIIVYLQPTSPFRDYKHIDLALKMFLNKKSKTLVSVKENNSFFKSFSLNKNKLKPYFDKKLVTFNRQELKKIYSPNGAIYIFYVKEFLKNKEINFENCDFFLMNKVESIDIDSKEDYELDKNLSKKYLKL